MTVAPSRLVLDLMANSRRAMPPAGQVVRLDSGDPNMNTPEPIRRALAAALDEGRVHYANPQGDPELRAALAARLSARAGTTHSPDQVLITHGATGALAAAILGIVNPGDRVVIPEPTYSLYADLVRLAGGRVIDVPTVAPTFSLDLDALAKALPGGRLLILCNPCNPTGAVYGRNDLAAVAELARRHGVLVLSDEAYDHIVYPGRPFCSVLELGLGNLAIYVQSFSKTYAMTGWRLGYVAASAELVAAFTRFHRTVNGPVNSAVQRAGLAALDLNGTWYRDMLAEYERRRELVVEGLSGSIELTAPAGTFYAFLPHPPGISSVEMVALAARHGVALRPGTEFGPSGEGFLRLAFSSSRDEIVEGCERLAAALAEAASR